MPCFNPRDIVDNIKRLLDGQEIVPLEPWYRGFKVSLFFFSCLFFLHNGGCALSPLE